MRSAIKRVGFGLVALGAAPVVAQTPPPSPLALSVSEAFRLGFSVTGAGARATGMGGAFVAVADDATAASFNPAGLAQLRTFEVSLVGRRSTFDMELGAERDPKATGFNPMYDTYHGSSKTEPQFMSFTAPFMIGERNAVVQVSRQRLFTMNMDYGRDWFAQDAVDPTASRQLHEQVAQEGSVERWSLAGAIDLTPRLMMGLAWNSWGGHWTFHGEGLAVQVPTPRFRGPIEASAILDQDNHLHGENFTLGLLWRGDTVRVGASYQNPFTAKYRYSGHYTGVTSFTLLKVVDFDLETAGATYDVHWPETFSAGISYRPHPQFQVALDWSRTPWSKAKMSAPGTVFNGQNFLDPASPSTNGTGGLMKPGIPVDTEALRGGVEYLMMVGRVIVPLRAGYFKEPQPMRNQKTGENRVLKGFTLGAGVKVGPVLFDMAYKMGKSTRNVSNLNTTLSAAETTVFGDSVGVEEEKLKTRELVFSVIYQFKGEWIRNATRWLVVDGGE